MAGILASYAMHEYKQGMSSSYWSLVKRGSMSPKVFSQAGTITGNHVTEMALGIQKYGIGCEMVLLDIMQYAYNYIGSPHKYTTLNAGISRFHKGLSIKNNWFIHTINGEAKYVAPTTSVFEVALWAFEIFVNIECAECVSSFLTAVCKYHPPNPELAKTLKVGDPIYSEYIAQIPKSQPKSLEKFISGIVPHIAVNWSIFYESFRSLDNVIDMPDGVECQMCGLSVPELVSHHMSACNSGFCIGLSCSKCVTECNYQSDLCPYCRAKTLNLDKE